MWVTIVDLVCVLHPWRYIGRRVDASVLNHKVSPLDVTYFDVVDSPIDFFVVVKQGIPTRAKQRRHPYIQKGIYFSSWHL